MSLTIQDFDNSYPSQNEDWRMVCQLHEYAAEFATCTCGESWGPIDSDEDVTQAYAFYTLHVANFGMKVAYNLGLIEGRKQGPNS